MAIYKSYMYTQEEPDAPEQFVGIAVRMDTPTKERVEFMVSKKMPDEEAASATADAWVKGKRADYYLDANIEP